MDKKEMNEKEKMDWVCSQLEDEESKFIFKKRREFNLTRNYKLIWEIIDNYVTELSDYKWYSGKEQELIQVVKERGKKVIIFGAGNYGKGVLNLLKRDIEIDFFCDNDKEKQHTKIEGVPVIAPNELLEKNLMKHHIIIVSVKYAYDEIVDMLLHLGISNNSIYKFVDYTIMSLRTQYFDESILHFSQNEVFVDGGSFNFGTSKIFMEKLKILGMDCKKIYAFEPDGANFSICKKNINKLGLKNVELVEGGLWSVDGYVKFLSQENGSSHITLSEKSAADTVRVVALDTYIAEKVTFIKMDIEGAELEALKGARHIIGRDKPKLAICLYHKEEDIWEIPYFIKTLVPEYRLYIRHYSNCDCETILYAICE